MIKIFGTHSCINCIKVKALLKKKEVDYDFFDVSEKEGLAELAMDGLADSLTIPIVLEDSKEIDLNTFIKKIEEMDADN